LAITDEIKPLLEALQLDAQANSVRSAQRPG
jgi:hypothetical protein